MSARTLPPAEVLGSPFGADGLNLRPWSTRWDELDPAGTRELLHRELPATAEFTTSGTTGDPQRWQLARAQLVAEAYLLAGLFDGDPPTGVLSFAPPRHRFGTFGSVLLPAALGVPAWVNPGAALGPLPAVRPGDHWLVVAIPWAYRVLRQRLAWLRGVDRVTVLHGSARLPEDAAVLRDALGDRPPRILELLGSTETGAIATREFPSPDGRWTLVPGVDLVVPCSAGGTDEVPLTVRSPLLARRPGEPAPAAREIGDLVRPLGARGFLLAGRRERLVKVNGRRLDLDEVESRLRRELPGRDLACVPVSDHGAGEHFELLVTRGPDGAAPPADALRRAVAAAGVAPRRVRPVPAIARSATGKVLAAQPIPIEKGDLA